MIFFYEYQGIKSGKIVHLKVVPPNEDKAYKSTDCKVTPDCSVWQVQWSHFSGYIMSVQSR